MRLSSTAVPIIEADTLLAAYASGLFPMARTASDRQVHWVDPDTRGIIPLDCFHVPNRLARKVRTNDYQVKSDTSFRSVMQACAASAKGRQTTWINRSILESYCQLHQHGHAHSIEVWRDSELVGGLYGVRMGAAFFGESMFSRERDVSKIALVHLVARLKRGGFTLLDTQFITPHLAQFGAIEVPRSSYHELLRDALDRCANFYELGPAGAAVSGLDVLQETTQTS